MAKKSIKNIKDDPITNDYEKKIRVKLTVSPETKKLVMDCVPDFLHHHPELDGINVTENMIVKQLALFYKQSP